MSACAEREVARTYQMTKHFEKKTHLTKILKGYEETYRSSSRIVKSDGWYRVFQCAGAELQPDWLQPSMRADLNACAHQ